MRTFDDMLSKQLKDDEFRKEYEAIQPEMDVIRAWQGCSYFSEYDTEGNWLNALVLIRLDISKL